VCKKFTANIIPVVYLFASFTTERIIMRCNMRTYVMTSVVDRLWSILLTNFHAENWSRIPCASYRGGQLRYRLHELFLFRWCNVRLLSPNCFVVRPMMHRINHRPRFLFLTSDVSAIGSSPCGRESDVSPRDVPLSCWFSLRSSPNVWTRVLTFCIRGITTD
jgi:hypothetical protein